MQTTLVKSLSGLTLFRVEFPAINKFKLLLGFLRTSLGLSSFLAGGEKDLKHGRLETQRKQLSAGYKGILDMIKNKHKTMRNNSHRYSTHSTKQEMN